jgi:hypothetical protein
LLHVLSSLLIHHQEGDSGIGLDGCIKRMMPGEWFPSFVSNVPDARCPGLASIARIALPIRLMGKKFPIGMPFNGFLTVVYRFT